MLTRSTFVHAQNDAGSRFHYLASIPCPFLKNVLETLTRQWILDSSIFVPKANVPLVHAWCMFRDFSWFSQKSTCSKNGLKPSPEPHFLFAHATMKMSDGAAKCSVFLRFLKHSSLLLLQWKSHRLQWRRPTVWPNAMFSCCFWSIQTSLSHNEEALGYDEDVRRRGQMLCFPAVSEAFKPPFVTVKKP